MIKDKFMSALKWIKALFDAWKIWIYVVGALSAVGFGTYTAYEPVAEEQITPEYAIKDHAHPAHTHPNEINRAIDKHDPRQLGH